MMIFCSERKMRYVVGILSRQKGINIWHALNKFRINWHYSVFHFVCLSSFSYVCLLLKYFLVNLIFSVVAVNGSKTTIYNSKKIILPSLLRYYFYSPIPNISGKTKKARMKNSTNIWHCNNKSNNTLIFD